MAKLISQSRKSPVLSRPSLPCISRHYTINLTAGCMFGCKYCYAQGYRRCLGGEKIIFYSNSYQKLASELPRKKVKPQIVYFSTASEPFAPFSEVLDELYKIMELLLSNSVAIYISTKGYIPDRFLRLFGTRPDLIFAQIGITTINDGIRKAFEPRAAPIKLRLKNISRLSSQNIFTEARLDPLIPGINDQEDDLDRLFQVLAATGCKEAVASYLFLRNSNRQPFFRTLPGLENMVGKYFSERIENYCHGNAIEVVSKKYREEKYHRFVQMAADHGVLLKLCACKNPELTENVCHPKGSLCKNSGGQFPLF
jgi:DNA repair photolyase